MRQLILYCCWGNPGEEVGMETTNMTGNSISIGLFSSCCVLRTAEGGYAYQHCWPASIAPHTGVPAHPSVNGCVCVQATRQSTELAI